MVITTKVKSSIHLFYLNGFRTMNQTNWQSFFFSLKMSQASFHLCSEQQNEQTIWSFPFIHLINESFFEYETFLPLIKHAFMFERLFFFFERGGGIGMGILNFGMQLRFTKYSYTSLFKSCLSQKTIRHIRYWKS